MPCTKYRISQLPLPTATQLLTANLTPDPYTPSPSTFIHDTLPNNPSIQRRARLVSPEAHFSYVSPFPIAFPYNVEPLREEIEDENVDKAKVVERWLSEREAKEKKEECSMLHYPDPEKRSTKRILIGLSETGLRDCVPHLDVGDAFTTLGIPSLAPVPDEPPTPTEPNIARDELIDVLGGHAVLMSDEFVPWALRYSGHQFGSWAGQLGDGRAITVLVSPNPSHQGTTYELQLKGSGRTPYSRSADGLAVLRSSIREFLCSEYMQALGIPTTRSLSLVSLPEIPVARERMETACIMTRVAPSFIRIGNFEALNGPTQMMFFGGGQQEANYEALRILGDWVSREVLKLNLPEDAPWGKELVFEVARRNAKMVAGWQAYGFMHGVINTDNVSIMGLTIDYGPYAFMDTFDPLHICNHSDDGGRYAYKYQPSMIIFALRALLNALAPLIGYEHTASKPAKANWAVNASEEQIDEWRQAGINNTKDEVEKVAQEVMSVEYGRLMRRRLGLTKQNPEDEATLSRPLLDMIASQKLDFHKTLRLLCYYTPLNQEIFITAALKNTSEPAFIDEFTARHEWSTWLDKYATRAKEDGEWSEEERKREMLNANPRFVLRQWALEEVIRVTEKDGERGKRLLAKVLHMACNPYEVWGNEEGEMRDLELLSLEGEKEEMSEEEKEERRFCGVGEKQMLGFQCSCSS
uniref:Selenoprotein O n=1 Tax=Moniliophthora roreri TaxID=221103 RepID=A0A0W0FFL1_MONRR